jgi:hypothetical protein
MFVELLKYLSKAEDGVSASKTADEIGEMARSGATDEELWTKHQVLRGADGALLKGLDSSKAKFKSNEVLRWAASGKQYTVGEVLDFPELYKIHPEIKRVKLSSVSDAEIAAGYTGKYNPGENTIYLNTRPILDNLKTNKDKVLLESDITSIKKKLISEVDGIRSTFFHETTHAVQNEAGRVGGGNAFQFMPPNQVEKLKNAIGTISKRQIDLEKRYPGSKGMSDEEIVAKYGEQAKDHWTTLDRTTKAYNELVLKSSDQYKTIIGEIEARMSEEISKKGIKDFPKDPEGKTLQEGILPKTTAEWADEFRFTQVKDGYLTLYDNQTNKYMRFPLDSDWKKVGRFLAERYKNGR